MKLGDVPKLYSQTGKALHHALYSAVINSPEGDVVEIGSCAGGATVYLVGAAEEVDKHVYSVDPYPGYCVPMTEITGEYIGEPPTQIWKQAFDRDVLNVYDNVTQFNCDLTQCIEKIPEQISVAFIDGFHDFEHANREFDLLFPRIVSGGYLFLDDYDWQGIDQVAARICEKHFSTIDVVRHVTRTKWGIKR